MTDRFRRAAKGYSRSKGGLNDSEFKRFLIDIYPDKKHDIHHMRRIDLNFLGKEYVKSISINHPKRKLEEVKKLTFERPSDSLLSKYLIYLDEKSIHSLCKISTDFVRICEDDHFWESKVKHDFPGTIKDPDDSWKRIWYSKQG